MNWRDKLGGKKPQHPGIALKRLSGKGVLSMNLITGYHRKKKKKNRIKPPMGDWERLKPPALPTATDN